MRRRCSLSAIISRFTITCALLLLSSEVTAATPNGLKLSLRRHSQSRNFDVLVTAPSTPKISAVGGAVSAVVNLDSGRYRATVTPRGVSGEVRVKVRSGKLSRAVTALVLSQVGENWDQPEVVRGVVNTPGTEDSLTVSPDGRWLIVGTYSPVDLFCCMAGSLFNALSSERWCPLSTSDLSPASPSCNRVRGAWRAPRRPGMFGSTRILSPTKIRHAAPALGIDPDVGTDYPYAIPPVSSFGFRLKSDGSFGNPFVVGFDMDGYTAAPFKLTFVGKVRGNRARLQFASPDPARLLGGNELNKLYRASVVLGRPVVLAKFKATPGVGIEISERRFGMPLSVGDGSEDQGNSYYNNKRLWFDNERPTEKDLYYAEESTAESFGSPKRVGLSTSGVDERQPYFAGGYLYYYRDGSIVRSKLLGTDPGATGSWGQVEVQLAPESGVDGRKVGSVVALGEPNVVERGRWLYFVYVIRTEYGMNSNVGRVRRR